MRLTGQTAIVTGAAQGIGLAIARRLAADGANVLLADANGEKVRDAAERLAAEGVRSSWHAGDAAASDEVAAMIGAAVAAHGRLDILVNNAGGSGAVTANDIAEVSDAIWADVIGRNLTSTFVCCRAAVAHMRTRGYGRIVNLSSGIAKGIGRATGTAGALLPYASAKAGVLGLTYTLAKQLARSGITVNAVVPGFVVTEPGARVRDWFDALPEAGQRQLIERTSMGRGGTPEEIANAVAFLASPEASFVSGAALDVNGAA